MKKIGVIFIAIVCGLLLLSQLSVAQQSATSACRSVAGTWQRQNGDVISLRQSECKLVSSFTYGAISHELTGEWDARQQAFEIEVVRNNTSSRCVTEMYGRLIRVGSKQIVTEIYGTDGRCELPIEFKERSAWVPRSTK